MFVALLALVLAGCSTQNLAVEQPDQVHDLTPADFAHAKAPFTVSWQSTPLPAGHRFIVLIDRDPMAPGDDVYELLPATCKVQPGCPNKAYLESQAIYTTRSHHVKVTSVRFQGPYPIHDLYDLHRAVVVIADAT